MILGSLIYQCFERGSKPHNATAIHFFLVACLGPWVISLMSSGVLCSCYEGFRLTDDNKTCHDINECEDPSACSQHCFNNRGSFWCKCVEGYKLEPDMKRCKAAGKRKSSKTGRLNFQFQSFPLKRSGTRLENNPYWWRHTTKICLASLIG